MLKITKTTLLCILSCTFFFSSTVMSQAETASEFIAQGRTYLFNSTTKPGEMTYDGIKNASVEFQKALQQDSTNQKAHFFAALTAILNEMNSTSTGAQATIGDMLNAFGYTADLNNFGNYTHSASPSQSQEPLPTGAEITAFLKSTLVVTIDSALANLKHINSDFNLTLDHTTETGGTTDTEIDYGDILAMRSLLQFGKSFILLAAAYDLDNIDEMITAMTNGTFDYKQFMANHTALLTLNTSNAMTMAKTALIDAIDSMTAAATSIDHENDDGNDPQDNDLISFAPQDEGEKQWFLANFAELKSTLISGNQNFGKAVVIDRFHQGWNFFDTSGNSFWLGFESDSNGNIITGEFDSWRQSTILPYHGNVETVNIVDSDITFYITSDVYSQTTTSECNITLTGTLNEAGNAVSNGVVTGNCPGRDSSGNFSAVQTSKDEEGFSVNISAIMNGPLDLRAQLPEFVNDPYTHELIQNGVSSLPDPTIGGIFPDGGIVEPGIDKVTLWSSTDYNGTTTSQSTKFNIWTYDLPLNNITSAWIYPPYSYQAQYPSQIPIDLSTQESFAYNGRFGTHLQVEIADVMPDGWYTFVLMDDHYQSYRMEKYLTNSQIDQVGLVSPEDNFYVTTTPPFLEWNAATQPNSPTSGTTYYRVEIRDWAKKSTVYLSDRQITTNLTIPASVLKTNTPYKWRVQAFDSDTGVASNNVSNSPWRGFYTGSQNETPTIKWASINSRVKSNIPDSNDQIQMGINFSGLAPWEISHFNISSTEGQDILLSDIDIRENGYFYHFDSSSSANFPDGNFTLRIFNTNNTQIASSGQLDYTFNRLPVPKLISTGGTDTKVFQTTTPTFSWLPVVDETATTLYYKLKILDKADNVVYKSHFITTPNAKVPVGYLLPNCDYSWKVQVYDDNSTLVNIARNRADSTTKAFFIAPQANADSAGSITGIISPDQSGYTNGGSILVGIFDNPISNSANSDPLATAIASTNTGSYTLYNLPLNKPLYIYTFWDQDHNGAPTPGEWAGEYNQAPLILTNTSPLQDVNLALSFQVPSNRTIINFDNMNSDISTYLSQYGITITEQTPNSQIQTQGYYYDPNWPSPVPSSMPTCFYQYLPWSNNTPSRFGFTLNLSQPVDHFTFTRTKIIVPPSQQNTFPEWGVTTLDSTGQQLDSVIAPPNTTNSDIAAQTFNLSGPDIAKIVFYTDLTEANFPYVNFDDFILEKSAGIKGDIDGLDGINLNDLIEAFKIISGQNPGNIALTADTNGDGRIGLADIVYILKYLAR